MAHKMEVNGQIVTLDVDPEMPLLWALRDHASITGPKYGCGMAQCGACTVHIDGQAVRSCSIRVADCDGHKVVTIEGVAGPIAEAVITAWQRENVVQCGYCQSGQVMAAIALLQDNRRPSNVHIDAAMEGNICRCGTYLRIRRAIHEAARALE